MSILDKTIKPLKQALGIGQVQGLTPLPVEIFPDLQTAQNGSSDGIALTKLASPQPDVDLEFNDIKEAVKVRMQGQQTAAAKESTEAGSLPKAKFADLTTMKGI